MKFICLSCTGYLKFGCLGYTIYYEPKKIGLLRAIYHWIIGHHVIKAWKQRRRNPDGKR